MRALSILQPWAWLIANGHKDIENRRWPTNVRGEFLVHAGKRFGREQMHDVQAVRKAFPNIRLPQVFDLGGVVGRATLDGCVQHSASPWFFGPFGFELSGAAPLPFTPYQGKLGWFDIPTDVLMRCCEKAVYPTSVCPDCEAFSRAMHEDWSD